jgi:hypothetical protein
MIGQKGQGKSGKPRKKPAKRSLGVSKETRTAVLARSNHRCEKCGLMLAQGFFYSIHHRTPRGMGGTREKRLNLPSNLVAICGSGTTGCHGWIESHRSEAEDEGWLVSRYQESAEVPLFIYGVGWRYLTDEGTYSSSPP